MAMINSIIRRVFSSSPQLSLSLLRNTCSLKPHNHHHHHHHHHHFFPASSLFTLNPIFIPNPDYTPTTFHFQLTRAFANRRNNTLTYVDDIGDEDEGTFGAVDFFNAIKSATLSQMEAALQALSGDLAKFRTGRASLEKADHIFVVRKGVKTPLNKMGDVSVFNTTGLSITPYDLNTIKELEQAIVTSPMGMYPVVLGERVIAYTSPLTVEHKQAGFKSVTKSFQHFKQSIKRARQKALDTTKKSMPKKKKKGKTGLSISGFSADDVKRLEKEVDEMTTKYIQSAADICNSKIEEIAEDIL